MTTTKLFKFYVRIKKRDMMNKIQSVVAVLAVFLSLSLAYAA